MTIEQIFKNIRAEVTLLIDGRLHEDLQKQILYNLIANINVLEDRINGRY